MKFDWRYFDENTYNEMLKGKADYNGAVYVGDICIELIADSCTVINNILNCKESIMYNFYVAHEDTGYGYKDDVLPYDYADGFDMEMPHNLSYDEFKEEAEKSFVKYIESYKGDYSLAEHANRPLEIW